MRAWMEELGDGTWRVTSQRWASNGRDIITEVTEHDTFTGAYIEWLVRRGS